MAILMRMLSLGATFALAGCSVAPDLPVVEPMHNGIGWVGRQFAACVGAQCPRPTQKTLAIVELPKAAVPVATLPPKPPVDPVPASPVEAEQLIEHVIHFDFGKSLPAASGLRRMNAVLPQARTAIRIEVTGRTDDIGTKAFNDRLARQRAEAVREWLAHRGVRAPIEVRADGMCCYLDASRTDIARRQNRRVEIRLVHLVAKRDVVSNSKGAQ
jgi:outer membrane protein OmpA-like peptidoglycan-associated protein